MPSGPIIYQVIESGSDSNFTGEHLEGREFATREEAEQYIAANKKGKKLVVREVRHWQESA